MPFDPLTLIMLAVLAVLIFFMFRNSRKRQAEARELQSKVQPGAKVMTNFGVFGTVVSIDEEENRAELEVSPGTVLTLHRQTIARVVEPAEGVEAPAIESIEGEPEFGERIDEASDETPKASDEAPKGDESPKKSED
ncbi:preprotein translocase subunit YajC [Agromyces mediolanus]|uniref:preprotein translocase subunit YajC n=1 Tax=Agromyces mediolanus TaxID=41986 RepID=UPI00203A8EED|nr:preprotein translocase subunit YajC [Agromyces mediolanus]MCM3657041.1 preprotein translocase subunit YajC [Agromyces mediolanus]